MADTPTFPEDLPCPSFPYSFPVEMGIVTNKMNAGNTRVRRLRSKRVRTIGLTFRLNQAQAQQFSDWILENGYRNFWIPLIVETQKSHQPQPQLVRAISEPQWDYRSVNAWTAQITVETKIG